MEVELGIGAYEPSLNLQLWKFYTDEFDIYLIHPEGMTAGPFQERPGSTKVYFGEYGASGLLRRAKSLQRQPGDLCGFPA